MCALPNPNDMDHLPHLKPKSIMSALQHHYHWTLNPNSNDIAPLNFMTQDMFKITLQTKILKSLLNLPFNFHSVWLTMKLPVISTSRWNYPISTCFWGLLLAHAFASFLASSLPLPLPSATISFRVLLINSRQYGCNSIYIFTN